jgi:hypothetical protein
LREEYRLGRTKKKELGRILILKETENLSLILKVVNV